MDRSRWVVLGLGFVGCHSSSPSTPSASPSEATVVASAPKDATAEVSAIAVLEALEARIAEGSDRGDDRNEAYRRVEAMRDDGTADFAFARAALAGRLAERRGAGAGKLVTEAEHWARLALARDAEYDEGAATRMLGSLYVMAPGRLVEHGDAEVGLSMLEGLVQARPDDPRNHLRYAEALVFAGDPDEATASLCAVLPRRGDFRPDEQRLLSRLLDDVGGEGALGCPSGA